MATEQVSVNKPESQQAGVQHQEKTNKLRTVWERLVAPPESITDFLDQQRARLISSVSFVLIFIFVATNVFRLFSGDTLGFQGITIVVAVVSYALSRTKHPKLGAYFLLGSYVLVMYIAPFVSSTTFDYSQIPLIIPPFLLFAVALSVLLLNPVEALVSGVITLCYFVMLVPYYPADPSGIALIEAMFTVLASAILIWVAFLRSRDLAVIGEQHEALQQYSIGLENLVEERTQELRVAKEEAEVARDRAEQADRVKSQFLASMSHELRTPLNAILNFTEMTALGMLGPINEGQEDALSKSLDSGRHLLSLINDVLDITKMHSGMMKLFIEDDVALNAELDSVVATAKTLLRNKPVEFITDIDGKLPVISGDKRRIRQILLNLIANAAKFTEEGSVTLSAKKRDGEVLFAVMDTGPGIAKEEQEIIFEPFVQSETGLRHAGGTGLGLPISKLLAEMHGGRIWLESQPGEGAAFYVTLPVEPPTVIGKEGTDV